MRSSKANGIPLMPASYYVVLVAAILMALACFLLPACSTPRVGPSHSYDGPPITNAADAYQLDLTPDDGEDLTE